MEFEAGEKKEDDDKGDSLEQKLRNAKGKLKTAAQVIAADKRAKERHEVMDAKLEQIKQVFIYILFMIVFTLLTTHGSSNAYAATQNHANIRGTISSDITDVVDSRESARTWLIHQFADAFSAEVSESTTFCRR